MIIGIIPARYASSRLPGKPLIDIEGKSMIQRVHEQALQANCLDLVVVATDDDRIAAHINAFGGNVVMTHSNHPSGTDRCWEAYQQIVRSGMITAGKSSPTTDYIINIQGDEPFLVPQQIDELGTTLDGHVEVASQMIAVSDNELLFDEGEAKVIVDNNMEAIYFSRQVLPFLKGIDKNEWHKHHQYYRQVGMYAYRVDILEQITKLPVSALEKAESLEQLRWLQNGYKIKMSVTQYESHCIDTTEDIKKVLALLSKNIA
jgi:3-deoxy-manno-octulosonate cytidylyltransferase (CMP-KDO synthetase)